MESFCTANSIDVVSDPSAADRWRSVPDVVDAMLKQRGYRHVAFAGTELGGVSGVDSRTWRELAAAATQPAASAAGDEYDMGSLPRQVTGDRTRPHWRSHPRISWLWFHD